MSLFDEFSPVLPGLLGPTQNEMFLTSKESGEKSGTEGERESVHS